MNRDEDPFAGLIAIAFAIVVLFGLLAAGAMALGSIVEIADWLVATFQD